MPDILDALTSCKSIQRHKPDPVPDDMIDRILEAHSLGLGACWVHGPVAATRDAIKFKEILNIPTGMNEYKVICYIAIGWPKEQRKHPRPENPLEDLVYWEKFGNKERP